MKEPNFPLDLVEIETEVAPSIRFYLPDKIVPGVRVELTIETHFPEEEGLIMYRAWIRRDNVGAKILLCEGSLKCDESQPFDTLVDKLIADVNLREDFMERLERCLQLLPPPRNKHDQSTTLS